MDTLSGEITVKESTFFPFKDLFSEGTGEQESKQEVTKVVSLVKMAENLPSVSSPLKYLDFVLVT